MMGQLLGDVWREAAWLVEGASLEGGKLVRDGEEVEGLPDWAEGAVPEGKSDVVGQRLEERMSWHLAELDKRDAEVRKEIEAEEGEQKKRITSEDVKEGWSSSSVSKAAPSVLDSGNKKSVETIEVLNPGASVSTTP